MIFLCDVLAYTTYNHTYFLRRKKAIRRKDVPMNIKKKLGQTEMENINKATSSRNPINPKYNKNCSRQDKYRQKYYGNTD